MSASQDTIAALATPTGTSAIALLRVSGPDTQVIARSLCGALPHPRLARNIDYRSVTGEILDDVLVTFFRGPSSYSGEDTLEISCHGNPFIAQRILDDLLARGCRHAEPGEFTKRAFLHGRIDLTQAEAVMEIIQARSDRALAAANRQLRGGLREKIEQVASALLAATAQIEAYIDFPEEDLPPENVGVLERNISRISRDASELYRSVAYGKLLRDGAKVVILGAPNAGKSTLLNAFLGQERALVSAEPGTTRDFIEERLPWGHHVVRLIDTAGLNPSPAPLERLGMQKTLEQAEDADVVLLVVDASAPFPALPDSVLAKLTPERSVLIVNKVDLNPAPTPPESFRFLKYVSVSARTGEGLATLRAQVTALLDIAAPESAYSVPVNSRHAKALEQVHAELEESLRLLKTAAAAELVAACLRNAAFHLGEITGRMDNEKMLDELFATFCIGK